MKVDTHNESSNNCKGNEPGLDINNSTLSKTKRLTIMAADDKRVYSALPVASLVVWVLVLQVVEAGERVVAVVVEVAGEEAGGCMVG